MACGASVNTLLICKKRHTEMPKELPGTRAQETRKYVLTLSAVPVQYSLPKFRQEKNGIFAIRTARRLSEVS
jgi:hypothetical protein